MLADKFPQYHELVQDSTQAIPQEGELTFLPQIPNFDFNPPRRTFFWQESVHREEFRFRASQNLDGQTARGRLSVFLGCILVAEIPLIIRVESREAAKTPEPSLESNSAIAFRNIFASYARKDLPIVMAFEEYAKGMGDKYMRDLLDLRAGEEWSPRLMEMIRQAHIFQLFWSQNSMYSPFVQQEWQYALALQRPNFVRPVYWEEPMPKDPARNLPPEELQRLNFARVYLLAAPKGVKQDFAHAKAWFEKAATQGHTNLAALLRATNRLAEAEPLYCRALAIYEASFGPDHPNVAISLNNLALLLQATNRLTEAELLMCRAMRIDEKSYGPDHPNVARDLNNLAGLLCDTNRLAEAEPLYRRALRIDEASFCPDHPNVARDLNNLALLLQDTNRLTEAEPLYRRALSIDEASFGPDHPEVAIRLNNLATLLNSTGRYAEAEPLYSRVVEILEKSLGPDHPNVATALNNLAGLLYATGRLSEAEPLIRRQLKIFIQFTRRTRHEHPYLREAGNNYARLLQALGLSEAEVEKKLQSLEVELPTAAEAAAPPSSHAYPGTELSDRAERQPELSVSYKWSFWVGALIAISALLGIFLYWYFIAPGSPGK